MNIFFTIILLLLAMLLIAPLRRLLFTSLIFRTMKHKMPAISPTEQAAIHAGTIWWEKSLLRGKPDWLALSQVKPAQLSSEEQDFLDGPVEVLCTMIDDWQDHQQGDLSETVWDYLKTERFFSLNIPHDYGGLAFSATAHSEIIQKISSRSISAAVTAMVPNSLGPAELLLSYGTTAQKDYYLPRLASGQEVPCFALTAPDAGSDAGAIPDTGIVEYGMFNGENILGIRLNWNKRYITLAPVATLIGLAFQLYDPKKLLGNSYNIGITVALIPSSTAGVEIGHRHHPLYIPFQNGPIKGHDVFIPLSSIIGGIDHIGQGWKMLMESLAAGRAISLPSLSCGAGKLACRVSSAYIRVREQFGLPIGRFEGVAERMAHIAIASYTINAVRQLSARAVDLGEKPAVLSAIAKYNSTEAMRQVINDTMDILGGKGICVGPSNIIAHLYMAIPIGITVEGANILTRNMIVFGQGSIRSNPYLLTEIAAISNPNKQQAILQLDQVIWGHMASLLMSLTRALRFSFFSKLPSVVPLPTKVPKLYQHINRLSALFSITAELSTLILGGALKRKESISGRLADALSGLYQASSILKLYKDHDEPQAEQRIAVAATMHQLMRVEQALDQVLDNFPHPWLAKILRMVVLPFGTTIKNTDDRTLHQISQSMIRSGEPRECLTKGIFLPKDSKDFLNQLEAAMLASIQIEPLRKRLQQHFASSALKPAAIQHTITQAVAENIITAVEQKSLLHWLLLRSQVIAVDDFASKGGDL